MDLCVDLTKKSFARNTANNNGDIVSGSVVLYNGLICDVGEVFSEKVNLYIKHKKVACVPKYEVTAI